MNLRSSEIIDPAIEGHYAFFPFVEQLTTQKHYHDFYEIFLVAEGSVYHHINEQAVLLQSGTLVFIRPRDTHHYYRNEDQNCVLINLAFLTSTLRSLLAYLEINEQHLHEPSMPPNVRLSPQDKNTIVAQLKAWGQLLYRDKAESRLALRALLAQLVSKFLGNTTDHFAPDTPQWLIDLYQEMHHKDYVVEGREALMRLSGRTPEYVGRAFKMYLNITPSQFINELRLDYASDLLIHSDISITDICFEVGFGNLSHFHRLFKDRWHTTPLDFRKLKRSTLLP